MNKKQLIVAWVVGILICIAFISSPFKIVKKPVFREPTAEEIRKHELGRQKGVTYFGSPRTEKIGVKRTIKGRSIKVIPIYLGIIIPPILIIGGLLIYTLKDKKK